jgi:hypothetical protein
MVCEIALNGHLNALADLRQRYLCGAWIGGASGQQAGRIGDLAQLRVHQQ